MPLTRVQALWTGFPGAPGYSAFHFQGEVASANLGLLAGAVKTFFSQFQAYIPSTVSISMRSTVDYVNDAGQKTNEVTIGNVPSALVGTYTGTYAAGVGAVVTWRTGFFSGGRQFVGRSFLVPLGGCFDTDGTLLPAAKSAIENGANSLVAATAGDLVIHSTRPGVVTTATATGFSVPDRPAVLRSRR